MINAYQQIIIVVEIQVGSWVAVIYDNDWWPGKVESLEDGAAAINFMMPQPGATPGANRFIWPQKQELDRLPVEELLCVLTDEPKPVGRSGRHYQLSEVDYVSTNTLMADLVN